MPAPAPKSISEPHIGVPRRGAGRLHGASFDQLLRELQWRHDEEVGRLRLDIAALKAEPPPDGRPTQQPAGDEDLGCRSLSELTGPEEAGSPETVGSFNRHGSNIELDDRSPTHKKKLAGRKTESAGRLKAYVEKEKELKREWRPWLQDLLSGPGEAVVGVAIILNVVVAFIQLELAGRQSGVIIGESVAGDYISTLETISHASEAFTAFFTIELVFKLLVFRRSLFVVARTLQWFNIFDAVIVVLSILDATVMSAMESSPNFSVLRGFRVIRILRVLRIARSLKIFSSLRLLVSAVFASFFALFWSMVLLGVVMLMSALFMCQALNSVVEDSEYDDSIREWVYLYYGTSSRAAWSMFELTFSGGWPAYARPLIENVSPGYAVFFALYVTSVTFAMFRIITALFLKDTLRVASLDVDATILEKMSDKQHYTQKLADFFHAADTSEDGFLTQEEFERVMANEHLQAYLSTLELDSVKTRELFDILDDGSDYISIDEFVRSAVRLKGTARAQDLATMMRDMVFLRKDLKAVGSTLESIHRRLHDEESPVPPRAS